MEAIRHLMVRRGNLQKELSNIGEEAGEGTEIQAITLFKLMKTFERVMQRIQQRQNKPVHTVVRYNYTMEGSRKHILTAIRQDRTLSFEKLFDVCADRLHAIFLFLSMLELVQLNYMNILIGEGRNNFIVEYNSEKEVNSQEETTLTGDGPESDDNAQADDNEGDGSPGGDSGGLFPGFLDASAN
jgi:segregation and condensation protein A